MHLLIISMCELTAKAELYLPREVCRLHPLEASSHQDLEGSTRTVDPRFRQDCSSS